MKGAIIGLSIAAPIGPTGILCMRRTFEFGRLSGFFSGLGAAVTHMFYGFIATFGLSFINFFIEETFWLHLIGGGFLIYLGIRTFFSKPVDPAKPLSHKTWLGDFVSTCFLTLTNPMTILSFIAIFAGLGLSKLPINYENAFWLISGVFMGSATWWTILTEGITLFRKKITKKAMMWINRSAGMIILGFGIFMWISVNINSRNAVIKKTEHLVRNGIAKLSNFY